METLAKPPEKKSFRRHATAMIFAAAATAFSIHSCRTTSNPDPQGEPTRHVTQSEFNFQRVPGCEPTNFPTIPKEKTQQEQLLDALNDEFDYNRFDCKLVPKGVGEDIQITDDISPPNRLIRRELRNHLEQIKARSKLVSRYCSSAGHDGHEQDPEAAKRENANDEDLFYLANDDSQEEVVAYNCRMVRFARYYEFPFHSDGTGGLNVFSSLGGDASTVTIVKFLNARIYELGLDFTVSNAYRDLTDETISQNSPLKPDPTCVARIELAKWLLENGLYELEMKIMVDPSLAKGILAGLDDELRSYVRIGALSMSFLSDEPVRRINRYFDSLDDKDVPEAIKYFDELFSRISIFNYSKESLNTIEGVADSSTNPFVSTAMRRIAERLKTFEVEEGEDQNTDDEQNDDSEISPED